MNDEHERKHYQKESLNSFSGDAAVKAEAEREADEENRAKLAHKKRNQNKRKGNRRFFRLIWWVMVIVVGAVAAKFLLTGADDLLAIGRTASPVTIEIPAEITEKQVPMTKENKEKLSGSALSEAKEANKDTARKVAELLKKSGVINEPDFFCLYSTVRKADGDYRNGTFQLSTDMDYEGIINTIQSNVNRQDIVKVTIPEGFNARQIGALLEENGVCKQQDFLDELNTDAFDSAYTMIGDLAGASGKYYKLEGYLFPDTYQFYQDEEVQNVVQKMVQNANNQFTQTIRDQAAERGYTLDQLLTLASIIQAEAADEEDMYNVSSVLRNRLRNGADYGVATLDCDSTMYYPYRTKADVPEAERDSYSSNYNTYEMQGLPAGAICNPGAKAIDAALNPNETSYYFFCHNPETQEAFYAYSYEEHKYNLQLAGLV